MSNGNYSKFRTFFLSENKLSPMCDMSGKSRRCYDEESQAIIVFNASFKSQGKSKLSCSKIHAADKGCTRHRSCYQDVTNINHIKREHDDFFSKYNAIPPQGEPSNKRSRRSDIDGFSVGMCVLCQSTELDEKGLHQIETGNVDIKLREAIERRNDDIMRESKV